MLTKEQRNIAAFVEFMTDAKNNPKISEDCMAEFEAVTGFSRESNMAVIFRAFSAGFDRAEMIAERQSRRAAAGAV